MNFLNSAMEWLNGNGTAIGTILTVLFGISKAVSTEKAVPIISKIQALFDLAAKAFLKLGEIMAKVAAFLAAALASDGLLGKK